MSAALAAAPPASAAAVGQCLITFQNSHRPQDLGHFISYYFLGQTFNRGRFTNARFTN